MKRLLLLFSALAIGQAEAQTQSVGSTDATFNVSDLGAATYTIPIKVPDGLAGLQPHLALNYNSLSGNDIMGIGWTLSGVSSITRIPNSIYNDKNVKGVSLTATDRFALDGNRLILTSGTYGAASSQYHTENENFKTITASGTMGTGPSGFIVTDENGVTYQYGSTSASQVVVPGTTVVYSWLLDKVIDLNGNYMTLAYSQIGGGEALLNAINYGGNQNTGMATQSSVNFAYATRSDPEFFYVGGNNIHHTLKLSKITVAQNNAGTWTTARTYTLNYTDDIYTHLSSVKEAGVNEQIALPPTQFTYGTATTATSDSHSELQTPQSGFSYAAGDYNGDGKTDVMEYSTQNSVNTYSLYLGQGGSGAFSLSQTGSLPYDTHMANALNSILPNQQVHGISAFDYNGDGKDDFVYVQSQHYNGSGSVHTQQKFWVSLSTGTGMSPIPPLVSTSYPGSNDGFADLVPLIGDFDGDGKTEILAVDGNPLTTLATGMSYIMGEKYTTAATTTGPYTTTTTPYAVSVAKYFYGGTNPLPFDARNGAKLYAIDYNGDGKTDVMQLTSSGTYVYEMNVTFDANNNPVIGSPTFKLVNSTGYPSTLHNVIIGDFNGDRISDVLTWISSAGWQIGYGSGTGLMNNVPPSGTPSMAQPFDNSSNFRPIYVADFNGDGKDDIYDYSPSSAWGQTYAPRVFYSKGNNVFVQENPGLNQSLIADYGDYTWLGDYNGDGAVDLLTRHTPYYSTPYVISLHPNETRHMISQVKNGLNAVTKVTYQPLSNASVYNPGGSQTYPFIERTIPIKVVSVVNADNGVNANGNNTKYTYGGLKYNAWGKGLMGFDWMNANDMSVNIDNRKTYGLNTTYAYPYLQSQIISQTTQGYIIGNVIYPPVTKLLKSTYNTPGVYHYGNNRIFTFTTETSATDYLKNTTSVQDFTYTTPPPLSLGGGSPYSVNIGKPMTITTNNGNGLEVTTQTYTFPPTGTWVPAGNNLMQLVPNPIYTYVNPSSITTTITRQGQAPYTRKSAITYNPSNGLPATTTADPGTGNAVTTTLTYDAYGNATQQTVSSPGLLSSTDVYVYDASHRYVNKKYNAAFPNLIYQTTYDNIFGIPLVIYSPDQLITTNTYDALGRQTAQSDNSGAAYNTGASVTNTFSSASGNTYAPSGAVYVMQRSPNTALPSYQFYDRLNRLIRTARPGFDGTMIYEDIAYNTNGQISSRSKPYFQNDAPVYINYFYDGYGRQTTESRPEGNTSTSYATGAGTYKETVTTPAGHTKITVFDPSGRTSSVTDNAGNILYYTYHSSGQPTQISMSGVGVVSTITYDDFGRKITQADPNYGGSGAFQYTYNAYNQMLTQQDPHGNLYSFLSYDELGNLLVKKGPEGTYTYAYDNTLANQNMGKLVEITGPGVVQDYFYGKGDQVYVEQITTNTNGSHMFRLEHTYDNYGRLATLTYPNTTKVVYTYNTSDGSLMAKGRSGDLVASPIQGFPATQAQLYSVISKNALGLVTAFGQQSATNWNAPLPFAGFAIGTSQNYDAYGNLTLQASGTPGSQMGPGITYRTYQYVTNPATGNLTRRSDLKYNLQEDFTYDNLDRLSTIQGQVTGQFPAMFAQQQMNYSPGGNIAQKTDAGTFSYDQGNKLSEINPYVTVPEIEQDVTYTPFNKVESITEGSSTAKFTYWADGSRATMMLYENGVLQKTKYYATGFEREEDAITGNVRDLCYVSGIGGEIVAILERNNGTDKKYFVLTDHLGSITHIIDENGSLVEEKSFDAWGRARDPQTWTTLPPTGVSNGWDRGYTGHELIPQFGIINMNGRLYDPLLGRIFSPDDYVQQPDNAQNYNRYSYCLNNPLKYNDPNGEWFGLDDLFVAGVGFVVGYLEYGISTHYWGWKALANGGASMVFAWLGYNTFGLSTLAGESITATTGEYAATYAVNSAISFLDNQDKFKATYNNTWNGVLLGAGYNALAALDAGSSGMQNNYEDIFGYNKYACFDFSGGGELHAVQKGLISAGTSFIDGFGGAVLDGYDNASNSFNLKNIWGGAILTGLEDAGKSGGGSVLGALAPKSSKTPHLDVVHSFASTSRSVVETVLKSAGQQALGNAAKSLFQSGNIVNYFLHSYNFTTVMDVLAPGINDGIWEENR
ncbi:FG-GAP-like repeat-containing protein [Chitinophagaceae bacterium MMS25-I14]